MLARLLNAVQKKKKLFILASVNITLRIEREEDVIAYFSQSVDFGVILV